MNVRRVLATRVTPAQIAVVVGAFAVALKLAAERNMLAAWGVVLLGVVLLWVLWLVPRLLRPARTVRLEESTVLRHSCEAVWGLIEPAEYAPLLNPNLRVGYRVPGTPAGLGERQALEHHDGATSIHEVIDYEPNRRAVTRMVSPRPIETIRQFQTVEPLDAGCRYTASVEVELKAGVRLRPVWEQAWRNAAREQFACAHVILDSGEPIVAPTRDAPSAATDQP